MKRVQAEREARKWSKAQMSRRSDIGPTQYGWIESGRYVPYHRQLTRIAEALEWSGAPEELLDEVSDDARD